MSKKNENKAQLLKVKIDLDSIKKKYAYQGKKTNTIEVDIWINEEVNEYGQDVSVKQSYKKKDGTYSDHYIGNGQTFDLFKKEIEKKTKKKSKKKVKE